MFIIDFECRARDGISLNEIGLLLNLESPLDEKAEALPLDMASGERETLTLFAEPNAPPEARPAPAEIPADTAPPAFIVREVY